MQEFLFYNGETNLTLSFLYSKFGTAKTAGGTLFVINHQTDGKLEIVQEVTGYNPTNRELEDMMISYITLGPENLIKSDVKDLYIAD